MTRRKAELTDASGVVVATFIETCHEHGKTVATVRLLPPLAPFKLTGTEILGLYAEGTADPVLFVEASESTGTEIREFHGTSAAGCVADGVGVTLVKSPGGQLGTLLIVVASGTVSNA